MVTATRYVVIDTNVIIYLITESPEASTFAPYLVNSVGLVSFQTVGELRHIALRRNWGAARHKDLNDRLKICVVVSATDQITEEWAQLMTAQMKKGSSILPADAWIAATALVYKCPVLTNDRKDFERIEGLELLPEKS